MNTSDSVKPVVYVAFHKADLAEAEDDDQYARIQLGLNLAHVTQTLNLAQSFLTTSCQPQNGQRSILELLTEACTGCFLGDYKCFSSSTVSSVHGASYTCSQTNMMRRNTKCSHDETSVHVQQVCLDMRVQQLLFK
jgi:hypothetical protein